ncbi:MAG: hypothetical protein JST39_03965 [Bacteroidetes bacterium]|nr:hypothetical protein [Bacteroidota bacterium]
MKYIPHPLILLLLLSVHSMLPAQTTRVLSRGVTDSLFTEAKKKELDIRYSIWKAYQYSDKGGRYYLVLSEKNIIVPGKDTTITNIEGFCLQDAQGQLVQRWKLKDLIDSTEKSIWFWTKYIEVKDIDGDGYVEPLVIYGSSGKSDVDGGYSRLKLLLYYKGNKIGMRFMKPVGDQQRQVQRDKAFSTLPPAVQSHIYTVLRHINKDQDFIWAP